MSAISFAFVPFLMVELTAVADTAAFDPVTTSPGYNRIIAELESPTVLELVDVSFQEAMNQVAKQHRFNIHIDEQEVARVHQKEQSEGHLVSLIVSNIRLRSALKLILEPLDLDYAIEDGVLMITSAEQAQRSQQTLCYEVAALLHGEDAGILAKAVQGALPGTLRQQAGVSGYRDVLLVTGNRHVHAWVSKTLRVVERAVRE